MRQFTLLTTLLFFTIHLFSQTPKFNSQLDGHWTGALIKGRSVQAFEVDFFMENDTLRSSLTIPDWAYYKPVVRPVKQDSGRYEIACYYGWMKLSLDSTYGELIGEFDFANVHMKKSLRPPLAEIEVIPMEFDLGDIKLNGELTRLKGNTAIPTAILVHGRGCGNLHSWQNRPAVLARYGLAVLTFDKRGSEQSGFDCETTNLSMHADDLAAISKQLSKRKNIGQIGYIGYSAGGWVAPMAAARAEVPIEFIVSLAGPSTSILEQQLDCSEFYLRERLKVGDEAIAKAKRLVKLECSTEPAAVLYPKIMALIATAKEEGWDDVLDVSDIPKSVEDFDKLWLQRNRYDPANDLKSFNGPFLSILGGNDDIVPWEPNSQRFFELFETCGKENFEVVVLPSATHGLEHGGIERSLEKFELGEPFEYYKFDRVAAGALDEIVRFLREQDVISR